MEDYKTEFLNYLLRTDTLKFGSFTTKSGRQSPYFLNLGNFNSALKLASLSSFYAAHVQTLGLHESNPILFGPAYKGISLAIGTSYALSSHVQKDIRFCFDRKESKTHGDKGNYVGTIPAEGDHILIVEDVITAGTTLREIIPQLRSDFPANVDAVVVAVDRCEIGNEDRAASDEIRAQFDVRVEPILTIHEIRSALEQLSLVDAQTLTQMDSYLEEYGR